MYIKKILARGAPPWGAHTVFRGFIHNMYGLYAYMNYTQSCNDYLIINHDDQAVAKLYM